MRFIDENARAVRFGDVDQLLQIPEIAVHRVNSLDHDQLAFAGLPAKRRRRATPDRCARTFPIGSAKESRHRADSDANDYRESRRRFCGADPEIVPSAPPKPLLKSIASSRPRNCAILRSSSRCRSVMPESMGEPQAPSPCVRQRIVRGGDDLGMIGQAEIIVGAKIDDRSAACPS